MMRSAALTFIVLMWILIDISSAGQVNCFIYHRFGESRYPSTNIAAEIFVEQLDYLRAHDIEVISSEDLVARIMNGEPLPDHAAALTVDDAFTSFYEVGLPIVKEYGYPLTLFVNTDAVGSNGYMSWEQLKEAQDAGVAIGNHSATHDYLIEKQGTETLEQWRDRVEADIQRAQDAFKHHLGIAPVLIAYPFGEYSDELVSVVKELGFKAAYAQQSGVISDKQPLYNLPRFPMGGPFATFDGFVRKFKMKPLVVIEQSPQSPLILDQNPPSLSLKFADNSVHAKRLNCFVQGDNKCSVVRDEQRGEGWYRVEAEQPLAGRRNKYTLTMMDRDGGWMWFSHPWVQNDKAAY